MADTREKLIELLGYETCKDKNCIGCKHYSDEAGCIDYLKAEIADHIIANGVVLVVRCKDCKHWLHMEDGFGDCTNGRFHLDGHADPTMNADDYCSCGERKDNG